MLNKYKYCMRFDKNMKVWIALGALILVILTINYAGAFFSDCPRHVYGTSEKKIKYFSSPLCLACWTQKPILEKVSSEDNVSFEEYDVDFCREAASPHYVRGIPAFIVNNTVIYGLQTEEQLKGMI